MKIILFPELMERQVLIHSLRNKEKLQKALFEFLVLFLLGVLWI